MTKTEKIIKTYKENPTLSNRQIADIVGCSRRLVRLNLNETGLKKSKVPKILLLDIETSLMEVYTFRIFKQYLSPRQIKKDWSIISWAAKWLFDNKIMSEKVKAKEAINRKDKSIIKNLWSLCNKADIIIGHNIQRFDVRKINLRFALNKLNPPLPYRTVDLMKHSMRIFDSSSFKLDYLNNIFELNVKENAPYEWWVGAVNGDQKCINNIANYNKFDVLITEELYLALRPWIKSHPNLALYIDTDQVICTNCGNEKLKWKGFYYTPAGKYKAFRCLNCGAVGRSRISSLTKEERAKLLLSVAS